jgi:fatty-acyl-CoA synthase
VYPGAIAAADPERHAAIMAGTGETLSYGELDDRSIRLARVLREAGLRRGDHVALLTGNDLRAFEVYWAALRSGLYITAVNSHLAADEAAYIVSDCGAQALVASAALAEVAAVVVAQLPSVQTRLAFGGPVAGFDSYEDALAGSSGEPLAEEPAGSDMLYSSGTTGRPKGIKQPLPDRPVSEVGNAYVKLFSRQYRLDSATVYLSPAPIYHASPLRFTGAIDGTGGTVVMMERFDAEAALAAIERYRVTHSQWVPTHFVRMLKLPAEVRERYDVSSMRFAVHAAAPCPVEVKGAMLEWWGPVLYEGFASTEGAGATFIGPEEWLRKPGSVGRAVVGVIHICDDDGTELPAGEDGLIYFQRSREAFRYHNDDEKTRSSQHPEQPTWTTTGDIGHVDSDGYLFLTDRKSFMIISGGVNIYPQEIENALTLHPKVADVAVIGVPDPEMGEAVRAVVKLARGVSGSPELERDLIDYVRARIARYKAPRAVDFVDELPRTPTGKLLKHELRQRYATPDRT